MNFGEQEIRDRLMVAIGAESNIENIHVRRAAAKAAASEVATILQEHAHELAEKIRLGWDETRGATQASKVMAFAADLIDPQEES